MRRQRRSGQATMEFALTYAGVFLPLTIMIIFTGQLLWTWHAVVEMTRAGARYAATHCFQSGGANVVQYMRTNTPVSPDSGAFQGGSAEIAVTYFQRNIETGDLEDFACDGSADCTRECVPAAVKVAVANYEFRGVQAYFGLPPVTLPDFSTTVPIESAGCGPDSTDCTP